MKSILASVLATVLMLGSMPAFASVAESSFTDVPSDTWYTQAVAFAYSKGLMSGVGRDRFDPQGAATRAMAVTA